MKGHCIVRNLPVKDDYSVKFASIIFLIAIISATSPTSAQQFELTNNFLQNLSFITGTDRGMEQNLDDNFAWMQQQGYTHLRFFGILPNGRYMFPSPTLEANGYPAHSYFESVLELLVLKANEYGITVNFDGWEVIAESNMDTTVLGVSFITEEELAAVIQDVLSLGVGLITEEQFGGSYMQTFQETTNQMGATHETTSALWWQYDSVPLLADQQLGNYFSFYPLDQTEVDSVLGGGFHQSYPSNIGLTHTILESAKYYNIPISIAVGSFGTLESHNWKNIMLFAQIVHSPDRFSVEESDTEMLIWDSNFNFMAYVGNEIEDYTDQSITGRPVANLVYDLSTLYTEAFYPSWFAALVNSSAVVNTFASMGYRVIATANSALPEAEAYFILLAGGESYPYVAELPDYVMPLLEGTKSVFIQPTFGTPDHNDDPSWVPLREYFGLQPGETQTLSNSIPATVVYDGMSVSWCGFELYLTSLIEQIAVDQVDTGMVSIALSADVLQEDIALIIQRENTFLINSNLIHLGAFYILSDLLEGSINSPALADIVITDDKALIFAEHDTDVDIDLKWSGMTRLLRYDPYGTLIIDLDTAINHNFAMGLSQGELIMLFRDVNFLRGDANGDSEVNVGDAVYIINYVFKGGPAPDPLEAGDANCDGGCDVGDAVYLINYVFKGGPEPCCP